MGIDVAQRPGFYSAGVRNQTTVVVKSRADYEMRVIFQSPLRLTWQSGVENGRRRQPH